MKNDKDIVKLSFIKRRSLLIQYFQFGCVCMLLPRLMKLQLFDNLKYIKLSDRNSKRLDFIIPKRGKIFDRNGIEIAGIKMETKVFLNKENRSNNLIDEIDKVYEII